MNDNDCYIITGKNKLTDERQQLTPPMPLATAREILAAETARRGRGHRRYPFTYLKIDKLVNQTSLWN